MSDEHGTEEAADTEAEHGTDKAEMESRDRAQPTLIDRAANLRADGDAIPDEDQREELIEQVQEEREDPTGELADD